MNNTDNLRTAILATYPSIYAFCKAHTGVVCKSVVMQLLAGKYPGNVQKQLAKVWAVLHGQQTQGQLQQDDIIQALSQVACSVCTHGKRTCRKRKHACQKLWSMQAQHIQVLTSKEVKP